MEIYTTDLIDIAQIYATKIEYRLQTETKNKAYIIEDECCNLKSDICNVLHTRLAEAFENLIENYYDPIESKEELKNRLFKIINDL